MAQWIGQKGSEATVRGFEPRHKLNFSDSISEVYYYLPRFEKFFNHCSNFFRDTSAYNLSNGQVTGSNPGISYIFLYFIQRTPKQIFFQTSKSTPFYDYFEPQKWRRLCPFLASFQSALHEIKIPTIEISRGLTSN